MTFISAVAVSQRSYSLDISAAAGSAYVPSLRRLVSKALPLIPRAPRSLSMALVGDAKMSQLHVQFLNIAGPTDVLTFELDHDARGRVTGGEIVVCVPEARRQAKLHGVKVEHELLLYVIHGLLHLTGHDDHDDAAYRRMHAAEDRILGRLGIGPVFKPVPAKPATSAVPRSRPSAMKKKDHRS